MARVTGETFGQMLRRLRIEAGLSQNQLARLAGCDPAYVNRLEPGSQPPPKRPVVLALAQVLELTPGRTDRLLYAAGLAPATDWQSIAIDATAKLEAISAVLRPADEPIQLVRRTG